MLKFQQKAKKVKKYLEILRKCVLFEGVRDEEILKMLGCLGAKVERIDKRENILSEGEPAEYIGILISGTAHIVKYDYYGNKNILTAVLPSEMFAEEFACSSSEELSITVEACEPCEVMFLACSHIIYTCKSVCAHHQRMIFNLMRAIAGKSIAFHRKAEITARRTTREKITAYLHEESLRAKSRVFDIPYDRQELADYLEVDRSGLSTEIGKMRSEGIIKNKKNHFELLMPQTIFK